MKGVPTPVVSWRKDGALIDGSGGRHRFLSDGSLQIIGLYRSDAGVYYCTADNGVGHPVQRDFTLDVTGISLFKEKFKDMGTYTTNINFYYFTFLLKVKMKNFNKNRSILTL